MNAGSSEAGNPAGTGEELAVNDEEAFLNAIRQAPGDDAPRLVYADWFDERGEPSVAAFVRDMVALYRAAGAGTGRVARYWAFRQLLSPKWIESVEYSDFWTAVGGRK